MHRHVKYAAALAVLVAVSAGNAGSTPLIRPGLTGIAPGSPKVMASLTCDTSGVGFGTCPTPNFRCHEYCNDVYAIETLECMAGIEGILPTQRTLCHGKATLRMGICHAECDRDYPV